MCSSRAGRHRHQGLLQRVLSSRDHPSSSERRLAPFVPDVALQPQSESDDRPKQWAEEPSAIALMITSTPPALIATPNQSSAAKDEGAAQHASAHLGSHRVLCVNPQPREAIALQPFQRQLDAPAILSRASKAGAKSTPSTVPRSDPQMEALLCEAQAQASGVTQATHCLESWQGLTDFPTDSYGSDQCHKPVSQPPLSHTSWIQAMPAASLSKAQQGKLHNTEATEMRAHETCHGKHSRPDRTSCEAAGAAQAETIQDASDLSEDLQGPSTPAARPGRDNAKQEGVQQKQQPGMASLLQQDVASLKGQVSPLAHHWDDQLQWWNPTDKAYPDAVRSLYLCSECMKH